MLDKIRVVIDPVIARIGRQASKTGLPPDAWTLIGFLVAIIASLTYAKTIPGGPVLGGLLLLLAGFFDILDGAVAKAMGKMTRSGAFLDSTIDRLSEITIYLGILFGGYTDPWLVFIALSFSLLVSYSRARAEPLGVNLRGIGIGERPERLIILGILSILSLVAEAVLIVAVLAILTFGLRFFDTMKGIEETKS